MAWLAGYVVMEASFATVPDCPHFPAQRLTANHHYSGSLLPQVFNFVCELMCTAALVFGALMMVRQLAEFSGWVAACSSWSAVRWICGPRSICTMLQCNAHPSPCAPLRDKTNQPCLNFHTLLQYERRQHISGDFRGLFQAVEGRLRLLCVALNVGTHVHRPGPCKQLPGCSTNPPNRVAIFLPYLSSSQPRLFHPLLHLCVQFSTTETNEWPSFYSSQTRLLHRLLCLCVHPGSGRPHRHRRQPRPRHGAARGARPAAHCG